jgi:hypothetical protein
VSNGYVFFLDTATAASPITNGTLLSTPNTGVTTTITTPSTTNTNNYLTATFTSAAGSLTTTTIVGGLWDLNLYTAASSANGASFYFAVLYVDSDGTSNPVQLAIGSSTTAELIDHTTTTLSATTLYVPLTTIPDTTKRIQIKLYTNFIGNNKTATYSFRNGTPSHLHTTLLTNVATGPTGNTGPPASDALAWTTYTPIWTADTSNPALGDGVLTGRYKTIGKSVFFNIQVTTGTTTTYGSGDWQFGLPANAVDSNSVLAPATYVNSASGIQWFNGIATNKYNQTNSNITATYGSTIMVPLNETHPFSWTSNCAIVINGTYESV